MRSSSMKIKIGKQINEIENIPRKKRNNINFTISKKMQMTETKNDEK